MSFRPKVLRQIDAARRRFGEDSGLIYDETSVSASSTHRNWQHKCKGSLLPIKNRNMGAFGASTLRDMVIRILVRLLDVLEPDHFRGMDWAPVKPLYDFLNKRDLVSTHVWKVFAQAFPDEPCLQHYRINAFMFMVPGSWTTSLKAINSPEFGFITLLEISNMRVTRLDLLNIPDIANLGTLTIGPGVTVFSSATTEQSGIDDAVIRAWSRSQEEHGTLSCLRALCLKDQELLTLDALLWATHLTNLASFTMEGDLGPFDDLEPEDIQSIGWEFVDQDSLYEHNDAHAPWWIDDARTFISNSALHASDKGIEQAQKLSELPMLHLQLSGPRLGSSARRASHVDTNKLYLYREARSIYDPRFGFGTSQVGDNEHGSGGCKRGPEGSSASRQVRARRVQESSDSLAAFGV